MDRTLTAKDIALLHELEIKMEMGELPYVKWAGGNLYIHQSILDEAKIKSGERVSEMVGWELLRLNCECLISELGETP